MSDGTGIEYADATWPIVAGCTHISPGCDVCFAARLTSGRLKHLPAYQGLAVGGRFTGEVRILPERLGWPLKWRKPRMIFVSDMADLFHADVPEEFIAQAFAVMALCPQHTFLIFTKRHARMRSVLSRHSFWTAVGLAALELRDVWLPAAGVSLDAHALPNVWLLVSVENQHWADIRIPALLDTPAVVRGISAEPLLGPIDLSAWIADQKWPSCWDDHSPTSECGRCIRPDWVIAGGETGPGARPPHPNWFRSLRDQCQHAGVAFWLKQWGTWGLEPPLDDQGRIKAGKAGLGCTLADDGTLYQPGDLTYPDGPRHGEAIRAGHDKAHLTAVYRVGKKKAGHELDGHTWLQYPGGAT